MYNVKNYFFFLIGISLISLLGAYFIEFILGHKPCNLCLIQRLPFFLCLIVSSIFLITNKNEKIYMILSLFIFVFAFILSAYHVGIENEIFKESSLCSTSGKSFGSTTELLNNLDLLQISCKTVNFKLFGLSLATINLIFSLLIIAITSVLLKKNEKNK